MEHVWHISTNQMKTVRRIYKEPTPNDVRWSKAVSLFEHLGFRMNGMGGSMMCFEKEGYPAFRIHRPHPSKHLLPAAVKDLRRYLERIGVTP